MLAGGHAQSLFGDPFETVSFRRDQIMTLSVLNTDVGTVTNKAVIGQSKLAKKASHKVIKLTKKSVTEKGAPTLAQQEALVVKYRLKARKLGRSILRGWHARLDLEEVDSLVDLSLCEAVRRFNPLKGASFMTFLYYHLKGNLVRAIACAASAHSIPIFPQTEENTLTTDAESLNAYQFRALNSMEVAEALYGSDTVLPDEALWKKELQLMSTEACESLDTLERDIIRRIFVDEEQIMEIASTLGYSRCHISRVKKKALETLHSELSSSLNTDDIGICAKVDEDIVVPTEFNSIDRRMVHRRRPRSRKAKRVMELVAVAA